MDHTNMILRHAISRILANNDVTDVKSTAMVMLNNVVIDLFQRIVSTAGSLAEYNQGILDRDTVIDTFETLFPDNIERYFSDIANNRIRDSGFMTK